MRPILILIPALLLAPACATQYAGPPGAISTVRLTTTQAATAVNDTYATLSTTGAALVRAGLLDKARFKALDAEAYAIVVRVNAAKTAGDVAFDYATALQAIIAIGKDIRP